MQKTCFWPLNLPFIAHRIPDYTRRISPPLFSPFPLFREPGINHEKGKSEKHEKLVTHYTRTFWTQIPRISKTDRWKSPLRANPNASIVVNRKP